MDTTKDFSKLERFPGETGNPLDIILVTFNKIDLIPSAGIVGILVLLSLIPTFPDWRKAAILLSFMFLDWLLLGLLPRFKKSYGPAKPPLFILAPLRMIFGFLPLPISVLAQVIGTIMVIYGFWIEPHTIRVTLQTLTTPKLKRGKPLRILHLGDLHIERVSARERQLLSLIEQLKPDLILFSGDILNLSYRRDPEAMRQARQVISQWKAPLGVYTVSGSPAVDLKEVMPALMKNLPVHWLENKKVTLLTDTGTIEIIGVHCTHRPHIDGPNLKELISNPLANFSILLYHTPDLAPAADSLGIDLQLSGHTHGGQVRLPVFGALLTGSLYGKRFESGRVQLEQMVLYVTRGIGMEGEGAPRIRFLCPPEIILWEISGSGE